MYLWSVKKMLPLPQSVAARLPAVYTKYVKELEKPQSPVHCIPNPEKFDRLTRTPVQNVALPVIFPKQADEGIWGGEGVVQGFVKKKLKRRRVPRLWVPNLKREVVYSEILNKYMSVTVTERTLRLIDQHCGFDNYILETPVQDLKSQLALHLRRHMLLALINKETFHDDSSRQERVWRKYEKFEIPPEEAEWFGLTMKEAITKQKLLENAAKPQPLKLMYRKQLVEKLKEEHTSSLQAKSTSTSWFDKIPYIRRT